jgi:hypothetical protein
MLAEGGAEGLELVRAQRRGLDFAAVSLLFVRRGICASLCHLEAVVFQAIQFVREHVFQDSEVFFFASLLLKNLSKVILY